MKKSLSVILALAILLSLAIPCSAATVSSDWEGVGVSPVPPMDQPLPFGTEPPDGIPAYNCHTNGAKSFSGSASWSTLWLNQYINGCLRYSVYVNNLSSQTLTFTVLGVSGGDRTLTLPGNTNSNAYYGGLNFYVDSRNTLFCISFDAPSNFSGYVSCAD